MKSLIRAVLYNPFISLCICFAVIAITYSNSLNNPFISDDIHLIVNNAKTWSAHRPPPLFTGTVIHLYTLSQYLIFQIFGLLPQAFRLMNIVFHAGTVVCVYFIGKRLFGKPSAFVSSLIFSIHPLVTESVTWISGGLYPAYGFFFFLSFLLYMEKEKKGVTGGIIAVCSYLSLLISLCISEKAVILFLLFFIYEACFGSVKKRFWSLVPYAALSGFFIFLYAFQLEGRIASQMEYSRPLDLLTENPLSRMGYALYSYIVLFFYPKNLTFYHVVPYASGQELMTKVASGYTCIIVWLSTIFLKDKRIFFLACLFLVPLLPTVNPLPTGWIVAERYMYCSLVGLSFLVGWVSVSMIGRIDKNSHLPSFLYYGVIGILTGWIIFLGIRTYTRNADWQNADEFWIRTTVSSPASFHAWINVNDVYFQKKQYDTSLDALTHAMMLNPSHPTVYFNFGIVYEAMGDYLSAETNFQKALDLQPTLWQAHFGLGEMYFRNGDLVKSEEEFARAYVINPDNPLIRENLEFIKQKRQQKE